MWAEVKTIQVIKSRGIRGAGNVAHIGKINAYGCLAGKTDEKKPLGRYGHRQEDNNQTNLMKMRCHSIH
jgi:hypothetical protein